MSSSFASQKSVACFGQESMREAMCSTPRNELLLNKVWLCSLFLLSMIQIEAAHLALSPSPEGPLYPTTWVPGWVEVKQDHNKPNCQIEK